MTTIVEWIALHEAELTHNEIHDALRRAVEEHLGGESDDRWIWLRDIADAWVVYEDSGKGSPNPGLFRVAYSIDAAGTVTIDGDAAEVVARTVYEPVTEAATPAEIVGDIVPLVEAVLRRDGTVPIKVIEEGWGTSGFYPADVLRTDGPVAFPKGTQMYWDHPTPTEEADRPERSLRDLAAVTVSDAYWLDDGPAGPALYADAQVFEGYRDSIEELAPHIGVSIRAAGATTFGEADGRSGRIVEKIVAGKSIDFVTQAGAGGEVVSLFESARGRGPQPTPKKEPTMPPETTTVLTEAQRDLTEARALGELAAAERDQLRTETARLREAALVRDARDVATTILAGTQLPDVTRARLIEAVSVNPPASTDGSLDRDKFAEAVAKAAKAELEYLTKVGGTGTVTGLGESEPTVVDPAKLTETEDRLEKAFAGIGLSESAAKTAATGR